MVTKPKPAPPRADASAVPEGYPAINVERAQYMALGRYLATHALRPGYAAAGGWQSTAKADQAKALFDVLWRRQVFGAPPHAPYQGAALDAFTFGYLCDDVGVPATPPILPPDSPLLSNLAVLVVQRDVLR